MFCGSRVETTLGDVMAYTLGQECILEWGVAAVFEYRRGREESSSRPYYTQLGIATTAQLMDHIFHAGRGQDEQKTAHYVRCCGRVHL